MAWNREDRYRSPDDLIFDLARMLRSARPLIAEFAPEALAPLAIGEAAGAGARPKWLCLGRALEPTSSFRPATTPAVCPSGNRFSWSRA